MKYEDHSIEARFLRGESDAVGIVSRWVAIVLTDLRFWNLRSEWLDLHQETLSRVLQSLRRGRFEAARDFQSYVQAVARHTIWHAGRRHRRERGPEGLAERLPTAAAGTASEAALLRTLMARKTLSLLSADCRNLIDAYFFQGLGYEEIASSSGVPLGTVKSRLFRCLEAARRKLSAGAGTKAPVSATGSSGPRGPRKGHEI